MLARIAKSVQIGTVVFRQCPRSAVFSQIKHFSDKSNETTTTDSSEQKVESTEKLGDFAKAFKEIEDLLDAPKAPVESVPFKKLLRESHFVDVSYSTLGIQISIPNRTTISMNGFFTFRWAIR